MVKKQGNRMPVARKSQIVRPRPVRFEDQPFQDEQNTRTIFLHANPIGSSGVRNFSGYPSEEYFTTLRGHAAADVYDKMRRQESQIKMVLSAVKNPIKGASWDIEPGDANDALSQEIADFCKHVIFEDMDDPFDEFLQEALGMVDFGFSVFEEVHKVVMNHPQWGTYNGLRSLAWRSQRTIYRWNLDKATGKLASVSQLAVGDLQRLVDIPAEFLMVLTFDKEGDNYEGISALRACYGPFFRKQNYLKLQAIGIEKFAVPTPIARIPNGKQNSKEAQNLEAALQIYCNHEQNYLTLPSSPKDVAGWDIEFKTNNYDPEKVQKTIDAEDRNMVKAFIANFLELGMSTAGGSWALSFDQSDFFLSGIEHIAKTIASKVSKGPLKRIVDLNYGPQAKYPQMKHSGISDEAGKELAESLEILARGQLIIPDDPLEEQLRKRYRLTKMSALGQRKVVAKSDAPTGEPLPAPSPIVSQVAATFDERRVRLAEKVGRQQIKDGSEKLLAYMRQGLGDIGAAYVKHVMDRVRKATPAERVNSAKKIPNIGYNDYRNGLVKILASIAGGALLQARREVPKAKNVKLFEGWTEVGQIRLEDADISDLPSAIQKKIVNKAQLLADSATNDLNKAVTFSFSASEDSTDSDDRVEADLDEAVSAYVEDSANVVAAAGNAASHAVNDTRNAFFFDDKVIQEIASFTFTNGDPVSPICQDLAGTTFAVDDPDAARYFPPLHHNCKSYLVPNLVSAKRQPEIDSGGLKPSDPSLDDYVTLGERASATQV